MILAFCVLKVVAQRDSSKYDPFTVKLNGDYLESFWHDSKSIAISPFHWSGKQWAQFGGVVTTAGGLYFLADANLKDWSQSNKTHTTEQISSVLEVVGNGKCPIFTAGALFIYSTIAKKPKAQRTALLILNSYLITGATAQFSKFMTSRHRPWSNAKFNEWDGPSLDGKHTSFFSGHSTTVWAFATVFAMEYKEKKWVVPIAYSIAGLSALSRIHDNAHWASDVFVGSAFGYFLTKTIVRNHQRDEGGLSVYPAINGKGLVLNYGF